MCGCIHSGDAGVAVRHKEAEGDGLDAHHDPQPHGRVRGSRHSDQRCSVSSKTNKHERSKVVATERAAELCIPAHSARRAMLRRYATNIWFVLTLTLQGTGWCSPRSCSMCTENDEYRFGPSAFRRAVVALVSMYDVSPNSEMLFNLGSKGQAAATCARTKSDPAQCARACAAQRLRVL